MMVDIPTPVQEVMGLLSGHGSRIVGGAVRDLILGKTPKDWDVCTPATPDEMMVIAERAGVRVIPTGFEHGTVTFYVDGTPVEVTTLREDVSTDGRRAVVGFTDDWSVDAMRRDLTINSLSMDSSGEIFDYTGGIADISDRVLRFVGEPRRRVEEDHLRILRFFRFASKFDGDATFDGESIEATIYGAPLLRNISSERIWSEMKQILSSQACVENLYMMGFYGILDVIGLPFDKFEDAVSASVNGASALSVLGRLFAGEDVHGFASRMRMSSAEARTLRFMASRKIETLDDVVDMLAEGIKIEDIEDLARSQMVSTAVFRELQVPVFPVGGADMIQCGLSGVAIGEELTRLKARWIESRYTLTKEELLKGHDHE